MSFQYGTLEGMALDAAQGVRPPERLTVGEAAEKHRRINNKGSYVGPWKNTMTPYLVEPMSVLTDLRYNGMIFVGPAQCGKTELYLNWHTYTVMVDPADLMLIQTSQATASDFSKRRVDRLHRDSPKVGERLMDGRNKDNTHDKHYRGGAMINLSWPSINEMSGKPVPRMFLTDYDRMDQDIDGNGSPWFLAEARTTSFERHGMTAAESSPSFPITDPRWTPKSKHEAPPTEGILSLYNTGDRRRWYWPCVSCGFSFEPHFKLLKWPESDDFLESAVNAWLECPHCQARYKEKASKWSGGILPGKHQMNQRGTWLQDGQSLTPDGEIIGTAMRSETASFWLNGAAARFRTWRSLVLKYLQAEAEFKRTGSEDLLKTTYNVHQGVPYIPKSMESNRLPETLKDRAEDLGHKVVPRNVRFLVASIDVQKNRFVVQIQGVGQGGDIWIIDRFEVRYSRRQDEEREGQVHFVRPFVYKEDWRVLLTEVMLKSYPLSDGSGREMGIKLTVCDSGGMDEGTANSYEFYRWLKKGPIDEDIDSEDWPEWTPGLHGRFQLYKGVPKGPRVRIDYPDSKRKDRNAGARGEIPVMFTNTNSLKNQIDSMLERKLDGTGKIHYADWFDIDFFKELCVEVKNHKGEWENPKRFRNESWDCLVMMQAGLIETRHIGIEVIDWSDPPNYALEWDLNELVFDPVESENAIASESQTDYDLSKLAETLG